MKRYIQNSNIIYKIVDDYIIGIDSETKKVFQIDKEHFETLLRVNDTTFSKNDIIEKNLISNNFLREGLLDHDWKGDDLSRIIHNLTRILETEYPQLDQASAINSLLDFAEEIESIPSRYKPKLLLSEILLPGPDLSKIKNVSLLTCLKQRKTCRDFSGDPVSLSDLSTILFLSLGYIHGREWKDFDDNNLFRFGERKSYPSATGLHPTEAFVLIFSCSELENGLYFYNAENHSLGLVKRNVSEEDLQYITLDQFWVKGISIGIFLITDLRRVWIKDPSPRGYIISYAEVGHVSENLLLTGTVLDLKTWLTGAFRDDYLQKYLDLDCSFMIPSFFVGFGHGTGSSIPKEIITTLKT